MVYVSGSGSEFLEFLALALKIEQTGPWRVARILFPPEYRANNRRVRDQGYEVFWTRRGHTSLERLVENMQDRD